MGTRKSAHNERSIAKEALGIGLVALGLLAALSLFTYDPGDPALNVAGSRAEVSNLVGRAGAVLADLLIQAFGILSLLIPARAAGAG
jgi:DNA segregation ATPase FtsK/SpoIIIE, S-DNA-T family